MTVFRPSGGNADARDLEAMLAFERQRRKDLDAAVSELRARLVQLVLEVQEIRKLVEDGCSVQRAAGTQD
jgi:hypothetical protein